MMRQIESNAELQEVHEAGVGHVYNDFSGNGERGQTYNVLHLAECDWVRRCNLNYRKYFFQDDGEAQAWLEANRGPEGENWRRCKVRLDRSQEA